MDQNVVRVARVVLWAGVAAGTLALLYALTDVEGKLASPGSLVLFYLAPALLVGAMVLTLRASGEVQVNVALLLISTGFAVYGAEAVLMYLVRPRDTAGLPAAVADSACPVGLEYRPWCLQVVAAGGEFDPRTKLQVIEDLEATGRAALPSFDAQSVEKAPPLLVQGRELLPLAPGVAGRLMVLCNEWGDWFWYEADERGFNNPPGLHRPDSVRVALVGDSYVEGWCVPPEQTVAAALRSRIPATVSLGVSGSGPLWQLAVLREYAQPLRPDLVVWFFYEGNDLLDLAGERDQELLVRYLERGFAQGLGAARPALDQALVSWVRELREQEVARRHEWTEAREQWRGQLRNHPLLRWLKLWELRQAIGRIGVEAVPEPHPWDPDLFRAILERGRDDVGSWGGELVIAYLPARERFSDDAGPNPHRDEILAQIAAAQVPLVDMAPVFAGHPDPLSLFPYRVLSHYTEEGYRLLADSLAAWIERAESARPAPRQNER
jgi:hypothetical protein